MSVNENMLGRPRAATRMYADPTVDGAPDDRGTAATSQVRGVAKRCLLTTSVPEPEWQV